MSEEAAETENGDGADPDTDTDTTPEAGGDAGAGTDTPSETGADGVEPDQELLDRVAEAEPDALAREIAALRQRAERAEADLTAAEEEVTALEERVQRVQADFQNYKRRAERRREDERDRAVQEVLGRLLPVRDNLARALEQDADADIRGGVESTLEELDRVLEAESVTPVDPEEGAPVDPERHEVVHREDDGEGVASVFRRGYETPDTVLRPAQVTVGAPVTETETESDTDTDGGSDQPSEPEGETRSEAGTDDGEPTTGEEGRPDEA